MDTIGIIVSALASGAAAGLKPITEKAIKDAYAGLKSMIQRKYSRVDLLPIENKPESQSKRESVAEDLVDRNSFFVIVQITVHSPYLNFESQYF